MCRENARTLPVSMAALSETLNVQSPSTELPSSDDSGVSGIHEPVNGASSDSTSSNGVVASSSNTVWHMLAPVPPACANRVAVVPSGAVRVPIRSPTKVWSMPTVVAPSVDVHSVPSIENVTFEAKPIPETGTVNETPAGSSSGIGVTGPV